PGKLRLRYLVNNASWAPSYNVRADAKGQKINVEYQASIMQMSGEDWPEVQMTLSTATPNLVAKAPMMTELAVALSAGGKGGEVQYAGKDYSEAKQQLQMQQKQLEQVRGQQGQPNPSSDYAPVANAGGPATLNGNNNFTGGTTLNGAVLGNPSITDNA